MYKAHRGKLSTKAGAPHDAKMCPSSCADKAYIWSLYVTIFLESHTDCERRTMSHQDVFMIPAQASL